MTGHSAGFERVTPLAEARATVRDACASHGRVVDVPVPEAAGRVLAERIRADRDVPHYDRAAMDGYALRAAETFEASERSPVALEPTEGRVEPGTARQVNTGEAMPAGADAVVVIEQVADDRGDVLVYEAVAEGDNVGPAGEDVESGSVVFEAGRWLGPSDLAMLRAVGVSEVAVAAAPRVSVLPTGDELVEPGSDPAPGQLVETNGLLTARLVDRWGGEPTYCDVVPDDEGALAAALAEQAGADLVVTTGGTSVGERDVLPDVVADRGELLVHGVAIKPGHPVGFGIVEGTPLLLLPGYPVSCLVTAVQLLRPAVASLLGTEPPRIPTIAGRLTGKLRSAPGERTFARVRIHEAAEADGDGVDRPGVEPVRVGGAGVMSSVTAADGWVEIPESREGIPAGETVAVQRWEYPE